MAIYKNREVQVVGPSSQANTPTTINVSYSNGSHENVRLGEVRFTADEKKALQKSYPSQYDNVAVVTDDDLTSVRVGVAPSFDPTEKDRARTMAQHDKQVELSNKRAEDLKAQAKKDFETQNAPKPMSAVNPGAPIKTPSANTPPVTQPSPVVH